MEKVVVERNGVRHHLVLDSVPTEYYCVNCSLMDLCHKAIDMRLCNILRTDKHFYHFEIDK